MPRAITSEDLPKLTPETRLVWRDGHQPPPRFVAWVPKAEKFNRVVINNGGFIETRAEDGHINYGEMTRDILLADPLAFPPLPPSREWHNPVGLTMEQVGEGWRPHLKGEETKDDTQYWNPLKKEWTVPAFGANRPLHAVNTYRTRAPLPTELRIKLGPMDLPGGFVWLRCGVDDRYRLATVISLKGITLSGEHHSWEALANNGWQWTTDHNADWHPCSKEAV